MKWTTPFKAIGKAGKFVWDHPELIPVIAASATGNPAAIAAGITTVVEARRGRVQPAAPAAPDVVPVSPDAPAPAPVPALVPDVDVVTKWRGTIDRLAVEILGYRMNEDEYYANGLLLEKGDVEGVRRNIEAKK